MTIKKYTEEALKLAVLESNSISDVIRKLNGSVSSGATFALIKNKIKLYSIDTSHFNKKRSKINMSILSESNERIGTEKLRNALLKSGVEYKCDNCSNNGFWLDDPICLEIDHKDNNHKNNIITNLHFLCPNCHSQKHEKINKTKPKKDKKIEKKCTKCGIYFFGFKSKSKNSFCNRKCMVSFFKENHSYFKEKIKWCSADELQKLINEKPIIHIAKLFEVSNAAVISHCKKLNLIFKPHGYWLKKENKIMCDI